MDGGRKEYDAELAEWSSRAEREVKTWLRGSGYEVHPLPHGRYGVDCVAENWREKFGVEIERRSFRTWQTGPFPYPDLNVLERRGKYDSTVLLFVVRADLREGMVAFPSSLIPDRLTDQPNRLAKNEKVFKVPLHETLPIDFTQPLSDPIAVLNGRRVKTLYSEAKSLKRKREVLGETVPYGMDREVWEELNLDAEKNHIPAALRDCDHHDPKNWLDVGTDYRKWIKTECRQCGGFIGFRPPDGK